MIKSVAVAGCGVDGVRARCDLRDGLLGSTALIAVMPGSVLRRRLQRLRDGTKGTGIGRLGRKAILGMASAGALFATQGAYAHTDALGFIVAPDPNHAGQFIAQLYYGTYNHGTPSAEGSAELKINGVSVATQAFALVPNYVGVANGVTPPGLVLGTNYFFVNSSTSPLGTTPFSSGTTQFQAATFTNLAAGNYTFGYVPGTLSSQWTPESPAINAGSFTITSAGNLGGIGGVTPDINAVFTTTQLAAGSVTSKFDGGTLTVASPATIANAFTVTNQGGTINTATNTLTATGNITDSGANAGPISVTGGGRLILAGNSSFTGGVIVNGGALQLNTVTAAGTGAIHMVDPTLVLNAAGTYANEIRLEVAGTPASDPTVIQNTSGGTVTISGQVHETGVGAPGQYVTFDGGSTVLGNTANSWTGQTAVTAGTTLTGTSQTISGSTIANSGTLVFNQAATGSFTPAIGGTGAVTKQGAGNLTLAGAGSWTGTTTISAGTLTGTTATIGGSTIVDNAALVYDQSTNGSVAHVITGTGSLTKQGTGTVTLSNGANQYTGGTNVVAGRLVEVNEQAARGTATISSGATYEVQINSGIVYQDGTTVTGTGTLVKSGAGTLANRGLIQLASGGLIDVQGGTLVGSSDGLGRFTGNLGSLNIASGAQFATSEAAVVVDKLTGSGIVNTDISGGFTVGIDNGSATFDGIIRNQNGTPGGKFTKVGTGTQTLTGNNTYTGATTIGGGTLATLGGNAIGDASAVTIASGATLSLGANETIGSLAGAGNAVLGANTLTAGGDNSSTTFSGVLGGMVQTTALGYIGRWLVSDGPRYTTNPVVYSGQGAAALLFGGVASDYQISTIGTDPAQINRSTYLDGWGVQTYLTTPAADTYSLDTGAPGYNAPGGFNTSFSAYVNDHSSAAANKYNYAFRNVTVSTLSSGGFTKEGSGTLILTGANDYTGVTTINGGTLQGTTGTISGGSVVDNSVLAFVQTASGNFAKAVSGSGVVTVSGLAAGNTLSFGGALTNTGGTVVSDTSSVTFGGAVAGGVLANGAGDRTLTFNGAAINATGSTGGSGLYIQTSSGTTTVSVASGATLATTAVSGNSDGITALSTAAITNSGTISSTGNAGIALAGGGSITNLGTIAGGTNGNGYGIAVSSGAAATVTLASTSVVTGAQGGVAFQSTGTGANAVAFSNAGQVSSARYGIESSGGGTPTISNLSTGQIVGGQAGIVTSDAVTIVNAGVIGAGTLSGGVFTANDGVAIQASGASLSIDNSGTVNGLISTTTGMTLDIVNRAGGTIASDRPTGDLMYPVDGTVTIVNAGTIRAAGFSATGVEGTGTAMITNAASGIIRGGTDTAYGTYGNAVQFGGSALTFDNYGSATSDGGQAAVLGTSAGAATVTLFAGSTTGTIALGSGDDSLVLYSGTGAGFAGVQSNGITLQNAGVNAGAIFGAVDLGGGANTLTLRGADTTGAAGTIDLSQIASAATLTKLDAGKWTVSASGGNGFTTYNAGNGGAPGSAGILAFNGTSDLTGAINVNGGIVRAETAGAFGTATITTIDPTVQYGASGTYANAVVLASANPAGDPTRFEADDGVTATLTGTISEATAGQPLVFGVTGNTGASTFVLTNAANSWSGVTGIEAGSTLQGTAATISGSSVSTAGMLVFDQATDASFAKAIAGTGNVTKANAGNLTLAGAGSWTGTTTIAGGTLTGTTATIGGSGIVNAAALVYDQATNGTVAAAISGGGTLTKLGTGTVTFSGNNVYTGATAIDGGVFATLGGNAIGDASAVTIASGATLSLGAAETIGSLAGAGNAVLGANTLTAGGDDSSTTFSGVIGGMVQTTALGYIGRWLVSDGPRYTTNPVVYSGQGAAALLFGGVASDYQISTIGTDPAQINRSTYLDGWGVQTYLTTPAADTYSLDTGAPGYNAPGGFNTSFSAYVNDHSSAAANKYNYAFRNVTVSTLSSGGFTKEGSGTLILTGGNGYTGVTTINGGTLQGTTGTISGGSVVDNGVLAFVQPASGTFAKTVSGSGRVTVSGLNGGEVLTFGAANTVDGGFTVTDASRIAFTGANTAAGPVVTLAGAGASLLVAQGASLTGNDPAVIGTATGVMVDNLGTIRGNGGGRPVGVALDMGGTINNGSATVATATISGGNTGINSNNGTMLLTVNNYGLIRGDAFNGIDSFDPNGGLGTVAITNFAGGQIVGGGQYGVLAGNTTIDNAGQIVGSYAGVETRGLASITNSGLIGSGTLAGTVYTQTTQDGIRLLGGGTVTNTATGQIFGGASAIYVEGQANASIDNAGTISAANGVFTFGSPLTIGNSGTISGGAYAGFGAGFGVYNGQGGTTLTNSGTIESIGTAIRFDDSGNGLVNTITNQAGGIIRQTDAGQNQGVLAYGNLTLVNDGTISTAATGQVDAVTVVGTLTATNSGTITAATASGIAFTGVDSSLVNTGTITGGSDATYGYGVQAANGSSGTIVNQGGGILEGGQGGIVLRGTALGVDNAGIIRGIGTDSTGIVSFGDVAAITNRAGGTISGGAFGINAALGGTIANDGTISGGTGAIISTGGALLLTSTGTLSGGMVAIQSTGAFDDNVDLSAGSTTTGLVSLGEGNDLLRVAGTLTGAVDMGMGDDTFTLADGGTVSGLVDGGDGTDAFAVDIAGASSFDSGAVTNFESRLKQGLGTLTLTGNDGSTAPWTIDGGTLATSGGSAINDAVAVQVNAAGTLQLLDSERIASLGGTGAVSLGANTLFLGTNDANSNFAGIASGTGGITKTGAGTLTLSGANAYTGLTALYGGTLVLGASDVLADGSTLLGDTGTTIDIGANSDTVAGLILNGTLTGTSGTLTSGYYALTDATVDAMTGAGSLYTTTSNTNTVLNRSAGAGLVEVGGGTLTLGASDLLADTASVYVDTGSTLALGANSDTVGSLVMQAGTLDGTGTLSAANYALFGATVNANLGAGTLSISRDPFSGAGVSTLNGTAGAGTVRVNPNATLVLGASDRLADDADVTVASGAVLDLGAFSDTVGTVGLGGTLAGSGTLTAASYALNGAVVNANLGTGTLVNTGGVSVLNGTAGAGTVEVAAGTLRLGAAERLADSATLLVDANGTLDLGAFQETVGLAAIGGTLDGTGTLVAGQYQLTGATVNANLGAGTLFQLGGTSVLNGTAGASRVAVNAGTLALGANDRLADDANVMVASGAVLDLGAFSDTVGTVGLGGTLAGSGTLTAASYALNGAVVNANLGAGTLVNTGGVSVLNGTAGAGTVEIAAGTLRLGAAERLADNATLLVDANGTLDLGAFQETVGLAAIGGTLNGTGTLVAGQYQLNGATVNANLGAGTLFQLGGTSVLNGTAGASRVAINAGTLALGANDRLADDANVMVASGAVLDLGAFSDTVGTVGLGGTLAGTGTLTAASYALNGATVNANLGAGTLVNTGGVSVLNGTAGAGTVEVAAGTLRLGAAERLADSATLLVDAAGTLDLGAFQETVGLAAIGGTLDGTGTLVAGQYQLNGATVNANLGAGTLFQLGGVSMLNGTAGATSVAINGGTLVLGASDRLANGATVAVASGATLDLGRYSDTVGVAQLAGTLAGTGTLTADQYQLRGATVNANLGAGTLFQLAGVSALNGTAGSALVRVDAGTLALGASERLADNATVVVAAGATLNLGPLAVRAAGTATPAGTTSTDAAALATAGRPQMAQSGTGMAVVGLDAGTLAVSAAQPAAVAGDMLALATTRQADAGALAVGAVDETVGTLVLNGTLAGTGTLTAGQYQLTGATVNANLGAGTLFQLGGTSVLTGTAGAGIVAINAGTLRLGAAERLANGASVAVAGGATFDLAGYAETVGTLTGTGTVALGAGTLSVGGTNADFGFGGTVSGAGDLTKTGTGTFTLVGAQSMTGRLNANAGTLLFAGTSAGGARIQGGTLAGGGSFAGNLALASGTLSPGSATQPIASFQVGSLSATGGSYAIDVAGATGGFGADLLRVTGAATLAGTIVAPRALEATANYRMMQLYTVLQAGTLSGTFANGSAFAPVGNNADLYYRLRYDLMPNAVLLELRKQIDFTAGLGADASPNQRSVGAGLNGSALTASDSWAATLNAISALSVGQRQATFDSIGGESLADVTTEVALAGNRFTDLLRTRLAGGGAGGGIDNGDVGTLARMIDGTAQPGAIRAAQPLGGSASAAADGGNHAGAWLQGFGADGTIQGRRGTATVGNYGAGVAGGFDAQVGAVTFGLAGAITDMEANVRARSARNTGTLYQGGGYVAYDDGATYANAIGSYFAGTVDTTRSVSIGTTLIGKARGEADTTGYTAGGTLGHRFDLGNGLRFTPQVAGQLVHVTRDAFTETGIGGLGLAATRATRDLYTASVQGRLSHRTATPGGIVEPYVTGGVQRTFGDRDTLSALRFTGAPTTIGAFTIEGARIAKTAALLGGGIDAHPNDRVTIGAGVDSTIANRQKDARVSMHVRIAF